MRLTDLGITSQYETQWSNSLTFPCAVTFPMSVLDKTRFYTLTLYKIMIPCMSLRVYCLGFHEMSLKVFL